MQNHNLKAIRKNNNLELSTIPDKLYFTIGEVAKFCELKPYVLRYWEQEFIQLNPTKRRGNRRYYQRKDLILVRQIKDLLYRQGFTIEGARVKLMSMDSGSGASAGDIAPRIKVLQGVVMQLETLLIELES